MLRLFPLLLLSATTLATPLAAQASARERRPAHEIPSGPSRRDRPDAGPESERGRGGRFDDSPHVSQNRWYGHAAPNDPRFHLDHPFPHGRFDGFGPAHRYPVVRVDGGARRLWFEGGFSFEVADWDWAFAATWCWYCGDGFVVYEDPDHFGWYLLYDIHTGAYVHAQYLGD